MSNGNRKTKQAIETMTNRAKNAYQHCSVLELPDALDVDINELISDIYDEVKYPMDDLGRLTRDLDGMFHLRKLRTDDEFRVISKDPKLMECVTSNIKAIYMLCIHISRHLSAMCGMLNGYLYGYVPSEKDGTLSSDGFSDSDKGRIDKYIGLNEYLTSTMKDFNKFFVGTTTWIHLVNTDGNLLKSTPNLVKSVFSFLDSIPTVFDNFLTTIESDDDDDEED